MIQEEETDKCWNRVQFLSFLLIGNEDRVGMFSLNAARSSDYVHLHLVEMNLHSMYFKQYCRSNWNYGAFLTLNVSRDIFSCFKTLKVRIMWF